MQFPDRRHGGKAGLLIAAPASAQGKTTVTLGLLRAFRRLGVKVASGKSGPDYIDPAFHAAATGQPCLSLDSWAMSEDVLRARAAGQDGDLFVVEGAMGLLDAAWGQRPGGAGSALKVAEALGLGVVLVLDASRTGQSIAAMVDGFGRWAPNGLGGVILNRVGSARHESILRASLEDVCPVLGVLPTDPDLASPSRHLGLVQASERADLEEFLDHAADVIAAGCDLQAVAASALPVSGAEALPVACAPLGQRIAVARDSAFGFSYWHMLEDWRRQGAEIRPFSPLTDQAPDPGCDAVFLPGGYPELSAGRLAAAQTFKQGLIAARDRGCLIYGECGGYMTLGEVLIDAHGTAHEMAGLLALETSFAVPKRHLGYRRLVAVDGPMRGAYRGHEFHYATTVRAEGDTLFDAEDASGSSLPRMGLRRGAVMGSFAHIIEPER